MIYNVKVNPGAKHNRISVGDDIRIWTTAKAIGGAANEAVVRQLSEHFHVPKSRITVVRGEKSRVKIIEIKT